MTPSTQIALVRASDGPRADSRQIAEALGNKHKSVMSLLNDYAEEFQQLGILPVQTEEIQGRGQPAKYALLSEDQCYFLLTLVRNSDLVVPLKLELVRAFAQARQNVSAPALPTDTDPVLAQLRALTQVREDQLAMRCEVDAIRQELACAPVHSAQVRVIHKLGKQLGALMGYRQAWRMFNDRFGLASYRDLPRNRFDEACQFLQLQIGAWQGRPLLDSPQEDL